jgi:hypothetical protein
MRYLHYKLLTEAAVRSIHVIVSLIMLLLWENRNGSELAGRRVHVRFFFLDARLYSVSQN